MRPLLLGTIVLTKMWIAKIRIAQISHHFPVIYMKIGPATSAKWMPRKRVIFILWTSKHTIRASKNLCATEVSHYSTLCQEYVITGLYRTCL